jgi:hypothetical protein
MCSCAYCGLQIDKREKEISIGMLLIVGTYYYKVVYYDFPKLMVI